MNVPTIGTEITFPLMEEYSQYGKSKRVPPEERQLQPLLVSRIHLTPGLDKCAD